MLKNNHNHIEILLIEDNPDDVLLTEEAFQESKLLNTLHVVEDGVEAIKFLKQEDEYNNKPRPNLILLDLNLPKKSGREVLKEIKNDKNLKDIPVVILTTSKAEEDIIKSYKLHANCYIKKPIDLNKFIQVVNAIECFWFSIVTLPSNKKSNTH